MKLLTEYQSHASHYVGIDACKGGARGMRKEKDPAQVCRKIDRRMCLEEKVMTIT
ncbi:MAG: hypothetical protein ACLSGB_03350 [Dorea sp.]